MKIRINSIKNRILTGFLCITFISALLSVFSFYYIDKIDNIRSFDKRISKIEVLTLNLIKEDNDFYDLETINEQYFKTKKSKILDRRNALKTDISRELNDIRQEDKIINIDVYLTNISQSLDEYNHTFDKLATMVYQRGFRDYGVEGEMRRYAHALEEHTDAISLSNVLSLRRHEKDFLLRNDPEYIEKHQILSSSILNNLRQKRSGDTVIHIVEQYADNFRKLVKYQDSIGVNSNEGLRHALNEMTADISSQFETLTSVTDSQVEKITEKVIFIFVSIVLTSILLSLILSYLIANRLSRPIKKLSLLMKRVMENEYSGNNRLKFKNPTSEIDNLSKSFFTLMRQTQAQMQEIGDKTSQLKYQNTELTKLNMELDSFIYSTAHDLRAPLSSILGLINLAKTDDPARTQEYLSYMETSVTKMEKFITDVVAYSKNKKLELIVEPIQVEEFINNIFENSQFIPEYKHITRNISITGQETLYSDSNRLYIILNNLISNAIRYSDLDKEQPFISIEVNITDRRMLLVFSDNGQGISQNHLNKIFNMFYRASEQSNGSGLGLFILRESIIKLKGKVEVTSELNEGTTFTITLPNKKNKFKKAQQLEETLFAP
ncbi:sensor histidine kinase [Fulvivirga ligni]|uniref:sensor histidine kinase n=1 Tax=Fulvivirga ligni TaxID=2904246 RepID=UPI001F3014AE|nr:HAMP domain-containing sensor histidine kinase [Fulvivirga ligni]UII21912.1 HAMP domain-containing histidine kinase [Fulvivirga ligni]